jgi:transposase
VEAIRALMVAKRSAQGERSRTINQARALNLTGPDDLRARLAGHGAADLVTAIASLRACGRQAGSAVSGGRTGREGGGAG